MHGRWVKNWARQTKIKLLYSCTLYLTVISIFINITPQLNLAAKRFRTRSVLPESPVDILAKVDDIGHLSQALHLIPWLSCAFSELSPKPWLQTALFEVAGPSPHRSIISDRSLLSTCMLSS